MRNFCTKATTSRLRVSGGLRRASVQYLDLAIERRVVNPVVEAATLQRVMHLAGAVRGQDNDGRLGGGNRAKFRNGDLKIRQRLHQEGLKWFIRAVDFVDQKDRCPTRLWSHGLQQRALDEILLRKELALQRIPICGPAGFRCADRHHLRGKFHS